MRTEILVTLLLVAVARASFNGDSDDDTGMCPKQYFKKHPEVFQQKKELMKKYGMPDFSKLKSCSSDGNCDKGMKCCQTPCGLKCVKAIFESNAMETIEQSYKEISIGPDNEPYEVTEEDKKYGMCPNNYIKTHPGVIEEMKAEWKHKHSNKECKHGEKCSHDHSHHRNHKNSHNECKHGEKCCHDHSHHKKHGHFRNLTAMADCLVDGDCSNDKRCCRTICGMKCVKPVFTKEDLKDSLFGKSEEKENRKKREVENEDDHDMDHRKGAERQKGQCKGGKHGKGHRNREEHEMGHEKGAGHGKRHGKEAGHGKGHCKGHREAEEHDDQVPQADERFRENRSLNSMGGFMDNNNGDNEMQGGCQQGKGKGKGKKNKGKKNRKGED